MQLRSLIVRESDFSFSSASRWPTLTSPPASILARACHSLSLGSGLMTANGEPVCSSAGGAADVSVSHSAEKVTHPLSFLLLMRQKLELLLEQMVFFKKKKKKKLLFYSHFKASCIRTFSRHTHWFQVFSQYIYIYRLKVTACRPVSVTGYYSAHGIPLTLLIWKVFCGVRRGLIIINPTERTAAPPPAPHPNPPAETPAHLGWLYRQWRRRDEVTDGRLGTVAVNGFEPAFPVWGSAGVCGGLRGCRSV